MRCGWYNFEGERVFIPGCESGWYNESNCTCYKPKITKKNKSEKIEQQLDQLQDECAKLKRLLENSQKKLHKANRHIEELKRNFVPLYIRRRIEKEPAYLITLLKTLYNKY